MFDLWFVRVFHPNFSDYNVDSNQNLNQKQTKQKTNKQTKNKTKQKKKKKGKKKKKSRIIKRHKSLIEQSYVLAVFECDLIEHYERYILQKILL